MGGNILRKAGMDLVHTIKACKDVYALGEAVSVFGELLNSSARTFRINKNFLIHTDLKPRFRALETCELDCLPNRDLPWLPPSKPLPITESSFVEIPPGEKTCYSLMAIDKRLTPQSGVHLPSGRFEISVFYRGNVEDPYTKRRFDAWEGLVKSNSIRIEVIGTLQAVQ